MRKKIMGSAILFSAFFLLFETAFATPFSNNVMNDLYYVGVSSYAGKPYGLTSNGIPTANEAFNAPSVIDIFEAINTILGTSYESNAEIDHLFEDQDSFSQQITGDITVIAYSAWKTAKLGVYTSSGDSDFVTTQAYGGSPYQFDDADDGVFDTYTIGLPEGKVFGWFLQTYHPVNGQAMEIYYSESDKNPLGMDHMMTFDLGGPLDFNNGNEIIHYEDPHLIAWENKPWDPETQTLGNEDYNDFMFLVDGNIPPVPEPATILLFGLGLLGLARAGRKK